MRERRLAAALLAGLLVLAGCGSAGEPATPAAPTGGAFPVTIAHGQGTATIPAAPQRVVVLGQADTQIAAALGAPIVGAVRNPSSPDGSWLGVSPPVPAEVRTLDSLTPNIEAIAALRPDLILMTSAQPAFSAAYPRIAQIAPTLSYRTKLLQDPGDELVRMIGEALGRSAEADGLIRRSDADLARFAAEHPRLAGRGYAFGQYYQGTTYLVTAKDGPSARLFGALGLRVPDPFAALPLGAAGIATLPAENLAALDAADVALFGVPGPADETGFRAQPLAANLRVARTGNLHFLTTAQAALVLQPNPATTGAVLDLLRPMLERVGT